MGGQKKIDTPVSLLARELMRSFKLGPLQLMIQGAKYLLIAYHHNRDYIRINNIRADPESQRRLDQRNARAPVLRSQGCARALSPCRSLVRAAASSPATKPHLWGIHIPQYWHNLGDIRPIRLCNFIVHIAHLTLRVLSGRFLITVLEADC